VFPAPTATAATQPPHVTRPPLLSHGVDRAKAVRLMFIAGAVPLVSLETEVVK
jgi:hypothetical protein